ncbi:hypothetical protein E3P86_00803 [Wallemia ichthyophaga]|uniref:HSF-type DNA-binding domain-containing protein n=1 Tax=Wallemia ichthyophaga TaxID=245174 RepID=A0A4T0JC96_WALIC|nr:hypothetical protein E3P86_00803 [Wallemia ichthyophaga]
MELPSINSSTFTHLRLFQPKSESYQQPSPAVPQQTPATATATRSHQSHTRKDGNESGGRFPDKLFHLLENPDLHNVIAWSEDGKFVLIHDPAELEKVMGTMWRSSAYPTFQRQMNIYGFSRTSTVRRNKPGQANRMMPSTWSHPTISRGSTADDLAKIERNAPRRDRKSKKSDYSKSYDDEDDESIKQKSRNSTTLTPALNNVSLPALESELPHESRKHLHNDEEEHPPAKRARRPSATLSRSAPSAPAMSRNLSITSQSNSIGLRSSRRLASSLPRDNKIQMNNSFTQMRSPIKSDVFSDDEPEMAVLLPQIEDEEDEDNVEHFKNNDSASGEELSSDESEDEDDATPATSSSLGLRTSFGTNTSKASNTSMDILAAAASIRNPVPTVNRRSSNFLSMNPIGIDARKQFNNLNEQDPSSFDSDSSIFNHRRSSYKDSFLRSQPNPISIPNLTDNPVGDSSDGESFDEETLITPPSVAAANYRPPTLDTLNNVAAINAKKEGEKTRKLSFLPTFSFFKP